MGAVHIVCPRCAGLDIAKREVTACIITPEGQHSRSFRTMTQDLLALRDWLAQHGVTHVAMESTGSYWKPVWNLLEGHFQLLLANAQHIKVVPGRKTDVGDAEWIADLLRHGLLKASFVPDRPQRELRELTRYRVSLVQTRSAEVNRLQKVLEGANIKLAGVASDIMGVSAQAMLRELLAGNRDVTAIAALAKGRLREKRAALEQALTGSFQGHQRFLVTQLLVHIDSLDHHISEVDAEVEERLRPVEAAVDLLDTIPGVNRVAAQAILAEIGTDMGRFPSHRVFASWAKLCPGNYRSAGKRKSGRIGRGNRWLRRIMVQVARAGVHSKNSYLTAQYHRLAARRGKNRAAIAVAHSVLITIYYMLLRGTTYHDLGGNYFDERDQEHTLRRLSRRADKLGFQLIPKVA